ncbi:MAG: hypothetical protein FJ349_05705 [Sphingomonadales bacterium]|nr:hypothetical protein [Sphingomonadales bacterium]
MCAVILLSACINGEQTYRVDHTFLLSGGNSKVWMLKGTQMNTNSELKNNAWGEVLFVFYLTGEVLVGSFGDLDRGTFDKGRFKYFESKNELLISIANEHWVFELENPSDEGIVLQTKKGKNLASLMHLVPLSLPN